MEKFVFSPSAIRLAKKSCTKWYWFRDEKKTCHSTIFFFSFHGCPFSSFVEDWSIRFFIGYRKGEKNIEKNGEIE